MTGLALSLSSRQTQQLRGHSRQVGLSPAAAQQQVASWESGPCVASLSFRFSTSFAPQLPGGPELALPALEPSLSTERCAPVGLAVDSAAFPWILQSRSLGVTAVLFYCPIPSQVKLLFLHFLIFFWRGAISCRRKGYVNAHEINFLFLKKTFYHRRDTCSF